MGSAILSVSKSPAPEAQETQSLCNNSQISRWHPLYFSAAPSLCATPKQPTLALKPKYICLSGYAASLLLTCNTSPYSLSPSCVIPSGKDLSGFFPILQPPHIRRARGCTCDLSPASGSPKFAQDSPLTLRFPVLKSLKVCSTFHRNTRRHMPATTLC